MLSVSIVLFKTDKDILIRTVNSILLCKKVVRITLIDNSPTNIASNFLRSNKKIRYIHLNKNIGYGSAHNISLKESINKNIKYHLVINPDVYFHYDVLSALLNFMEKNYDIGLVMPKILYPDGTLQYTCKLLPTPIDLALRRFLPNLWLFKRRNDQFELRHSGYKKQMIVPYLSGCFMFLRVSVLTEVGIFDERFFMYPEDIDLSRRIYLKYKTVFYPKTFVFHEHGKASYKNIKMLMVHIVNIIKYFNKWGWFYDKERTSINLKTLAKIK